MIEIYSDGSSRGNPGPGGYGVILKSGPHYKEISEGYRLTTNNRMELLGVIKGLEALKNLNQKVLVISDSKYVIDSVEKKWVFTWEQKGYAGKKNSDLWIRLLKVIRLHQVKFKWIQGHSGHKENERCDELAVLAATSSKLKMDAVFESSQKNL